MTWNSTTTFASMHKKKLGMRHLPLFDAHNQAAVVVTVTAEGDPQSTTTTPTQNNQDQVEDKLFNQFASAICHANVIPRKEIFETWSAALHIYDSFFGDDHAQLLTSTTTTKARNDDNGDGEWNVVPICRVVDVAAGHGLLAWALLLLDEKYQLGKGMRRHQPPLTAFCLDLHMPPSATVIHSSMIQHFSHLASRFDYVEGRLEQLVPHPSCLLASVHGCGILTDMLVATAAEHKVPLAVVPCCHSRKSIVMEVASPYAKDQYDDILRNDREDRIRSSSSSGSSSIPDLADRLDGARMAALTNAGLEVKEVYLPKMFTDKNRLIMGFPSTVSATTTKKAEGECAPSTLILDQPIVNTTFTTRGKVMPPLNNHHPDVIGIVRPKSRYMKGFYIPCQDSRFHRQLITQLSGKNAANARKKVMHNRCHTKFPQLDVSLWLPPDDDDETDGVISETSLSSLIDGMNEGVKCTVTKVGEVYTHPSLGRKAQTFRIQYGVSGSLLDNFNNIEGGGNFSSDTNDVLSFEDAKQIHLQLCESIPVVFPGAECR